MDRYLHDVIGKLGIILLLTTNEMSTGMTSSFSDESRFNLFHNDGQVHIYRHDAERYVDWCVVEGDRLGGGGVMVWGAINYNFRSRLLIIYGNLTVRCYVDEILQPELIPLIRHIPLIFQHDNARPQTGLLFASSGHQRSPLAVEITGH